MERRSVQTSFNPIIDISEAHGNLQIKGWERKELLVRAADKSLNLESQGDQISLECRSDCQVYLPVGAQVRIGEVHGNLRIKLLEGRLSADQIHGNLALRNVAQVEIGEIKGELLARYVNGDIQIERVLGNFRGRDLHGDCSTEQVSGNLDLRDVDGAIAASVGGNARLHLRALLGDQYQIECGGNLHCRVPEGLDVQFQMTSGAENIRINVPGNMTTISQESHTLTMGEGDTQVNLTAGGSIYLAAEEPQVVGSDEFDLEMEREFAELSQEISLQIEEQIESQMHALNMHMANLSNFADQTGLTEEQIDRIMQRAQESTEKATQRAREKMRAAQEKLERKLAAAQRKAEAKARAAQQREYDRRKHGGRGMREPWQPADHEHDTEAAHAQEADTQERVSEDERLMILRMLEQKKITPQEAERLLASLEGK